MAELHQLPDRNDAEREASEWIARLNADDVSSEDRIRFDTWRSAHPRHARVYGELLATWQELERSGPLVRAVSFGQSMNAASLPPVPRRRWAYFAAAAGVLAVVLGTGWYVRQVKAETLFETAIGEHVTVALPDGSSLELNSNSLARVDYREHARIIRLARGEAFFKVAHDKARPFWVVAGDSWVRAVGTAFNVYLRSASVEVTVSEGTVKVAGERSERDTPSDSLLAQAPVSVLTAGEQADVHGGSASIRSLKPVELTRSVAWRQGSLYFANQPLSDVVEEMNRYSPLQIEVRDDALRRLPVGGTFQANPDGAEALLTMLRDGLGLNIRRDGASRATIEGQPTH
jgi:transmembrane sensor